jgi:membrane protein required for colicin V production
MFDLLVLMVLVISGAIGLFRGGTHELVGVVSFLLAILIAILTLKLSAPIVLTVVATPWIAKAIAILVVFVIAYIVLRLTGGALVRGVRETPLSPLDRLLGLGFGLIRALVLLGVFSLVFRAAVPAAEIPPWVKDARLYPLTVLSADALQALAPRGGKLADRITPALKDAIQTSGETSPDEKGDKPGK